MPVQIIKDNFSNNELADIAKKQFGDFVKAVVDVEQGITAIGAELHADEESALLKQGSRQKDLWGINIYPGKSGDERVAFNSMVNIRPSQGNRSRDVEDAGIREKIKAIVSKLMPMP